MPISTNNFAKRFLKTMTKWPGLHDETCGAAHRLSKQRGYWRGSSCGNLNFYDSSSRSSSGSCRWTRGSLRLQLKESSWRKALKATAEQPETNMPPSGVSPSLPLQHGTKLHTALKFSCVSRSNLVHWSISLVNLLGTQLYHLTHFSQSVVS